MRRAIIIWASICAFAAVLLSSCTTPRRIIPTPAPAIYRSYMPMLSSSPPEKPGVGLTYSRCDDVSTLRPGWYYDWSARPPLCDGMTEVVPMIWGRFVVLPDLGAGRWLLGFNEPDRSDQANVSPADAAHLWRQIEAAYPERLLVAPAPSEAGYAWLVDMIAAYVDRYGDTPTFHALAVHCYRATAAECIELTEQYIALAREFGAEVWVTEWAMLPCRVGAQNAQTEADAFRTWMDATPEIARYAWFASRINGDEPWAFGPGCNTPLVDARGELTTWGEWYSAR